MITHSIQEQILYVDLTGNISFDSIHEYLKEFVRSKSLPKNLLILYTFKNVTLDFTVQELKKISQFAERYTENYTNIRAAFLVDNPVLTAYSTLYSELPINTKIKRKIFSTRQAALKWLKIT